MRLVPARGRGVVAFGDRGGGDGAVRAGRSQGELPRARGPDPRVLARVRRLPPPARAAAGRAAVGLLRGPADRERTAGHPPRRAADLQGRLPALQGDDGPLRPAQGRLGLPRPAGRARGREGDRDPEQARHRGVRHRRVQPPLPRVGPALRGRLRAADGADRLLDRHVRRLPDDGHRVHRERVVVAQATARARPAVPGRPHHDVLPAVRHAAVGRRGRDGLHGRRGPERGGPVPDPRGPRPLARRRVDARMDHDAVDADLQHRRRDRRRRSLRRRPPRRRAARPGRGAPRGRPLRGSRRRRGRSRARRSSAPGTSPCTPTSRGPTASSRRPSSPSRTARASSTWPRRSAPRTWRSAAGRGGRCSSRSTARAGSRTRRRRSSGAPSSRTPTRRSSTTSATAASCCAPGPSCTPIPCAGAATPRSSTSRGAPGTSGRPRSRTAFSP